jgi:hypothetical protein
MSDAKKIETTFVNVLWKSSRMITSDNTDMSKQNAVINFMGSHRGPILLKTVRLNIHPVISREEIINTKISDVHIIRLKDLDVLNNWGFTPAL